MNSPIKKLLAVVSFVSAASSSAIAAPRTLPNGAPAPGNTVAKGYMEKPTAAERKLQRTRAALVAAIAEHATAVQALATKPRTLPNGAPACGNTAYKAPMCTADTADKQYEARLERVRQATAAVTAARVKVHEATRNVAMQFLGSVADDDYS